MDIPGSGVRVLEFWNKVLDNVHVSMHICLVV